MRTLNGEVLIDDKGNLNESVWFNNLIALAELMGIKEEDKEKDGES